MGRLSWCKDRFGRRKREVMYYRMMDLVGHSEKREVDIPLSKDMQDM